MTKIPISLIKKLLIVRPDAIGDTVLTLPCIKTIKEKYPHLHITVMGSAYNLSILENCPYIDEIIIDKFRTGEVKNFFDFLKYAKEIKSNNFDSVVHFYSETKEVWLTVFAGVKYQVGDKAKLGLLPIFRKHGVFLKTFDQTKHVVEYNFQLLKNLDIEISEKTKLNLPINEKNIVKAKNILLENGWQQKSKLIGIHMGVGGGNRAISPLKFAEFVNELRSKEDCEICITGYSQKEQNYRDEFMENVHGSIIDLVGKTSLMELIGVFSHCNLYVGVDTGPFHLASAIGVPQLAIFPTRKVKPTRWAPWQNRHLIVRESRACSHFCPHEGCTLSICSEAIKIEDMVKKALDLLNGKGVFVYQKQLKYWFVKSMQILVLFDPKTEHDAKKHQKDLVANGFTAYLKSINEKGLYSYLIEQDITIIHNFSGKKKIKLLFLSLIVSLKLFNPPLNINQKTSFETTDKIIDFYKNKFEAKRL